MKQNPQLNIVCNCEVTRRNLSRCMCFHVEPLCKVNLRKTGQLSPLHSFPTFVALLMEMSQSLSAQTRIFLSDLSPASVQNKLR